MRIKVLCQKFKSKFNKQLFESNTIIRSIKTPVIIFVIKLTCLKVLKYQQFFEQAYKINWMITQQRPNTSEYHRALAELHQFANQSQKIRQYEQADRILETVNLSFARCKKKQIIEIFIEKLKRVIVGRNPPDSFMEKWEIQQENQGLLQGFSYPQKFWNILSYMHIVGLVLLLLMSSFCGYIDVFSENNSVYPGVIISKSIPLFITAVYFFVSCTRKVFFRGNQMVYLKDIIRAYATNGKLFTDLIIIVLTSISLAYPKVMQIMVAQFFVLMIALVISRSDMLRLDMFFFKTYRERLTWNLVKVGIFNIVFAHCIATILLGVARFNSTDNWIQSYFDNASELNWFQIYVSAFYWAATIMMTVGFGDITASTNAERFTVAFIEIFGCIILAYNISEIGNIISMLRQKDSRLITNMAIFERIITHQKQSGDSMSNLLQKRIYSFLESDSDKHLFLLQQVQLIESLPENLRIQYYKQAFIPVLRKLDFFKYLRHSTLGELSSILQNTYHSPGISLGAPKIEDIMILQRGKIYLTCLKKNSRINGTPIDHIQIVQKQSACLISTNFLNFRHNPTYDIMAQTYCYIWKIKKQSFLEAIEKQTMDRQYYFSILHKFSYIDNCGVIVCPRCSPLKHTSFQCPKIHYMPLKSQIIEKHQKTLGNPQIRSQQYKRKRHRNPRTHSSLLQKKKMISISQEFYKYDPYQIDEHSEIEIPGDKQEKQSQSRKRRELVNRMNEQRLENLMERAFQKHSLNYRDEFWDIEVDKAQNYCYYMPECNSSRFKFTSIEGPFSSFSVFSPWITDRNISVQPKIDENNLRRLHNLS